MILRSSKDGFMPPVLLHSLDDGNDGSWCDNHDGREESPAATAATRIQTQLRSLQAIDEALERIAITLDDLHLTDETYFLYTSDNGQHFGEHRIPAGKRQAYETDVLVPLLVRGPKQHITPGSSFSQLIQSVDLGPTILHIAAASSSGSSSSSSVPIVGDTNGGGSSNSSSSSSEYSIIDTTDPTMRASLLLKEKREKDHRQLYKTTYPMDGKSIVCHTCILIGGY